MLRKLTIAFLVAILAEIGFSQCSDAGICTLSGMPHLEREEIGAVGLQYHTGRSPENDSLIFHSIRFFSEREFIENNKVKILIPFNFQSGPLGNVSGIGDLILSLQHIITYVNDISLSIEAGMKLATAKQNVDSLPQHYQSGLGTNDLLLNAAYSNKGFHAALGFQHPFGRSSNRELLKRGSDLSIRVGYESRYEKIGVDAAVIAVKNFGLQNIADSSNHGLFAPTVDVPNSDQFQINLLTEMKYFHSQPFSVNLGIAIPLLKRKVNIDGLSRSLSISAGVYITY